LAALTLRSMPEAKPPLTKCLLSLDHWQWGIPVTLSLAERDITAPISGPRWTRNWPSSWSLSFLEQWLSLPGPLLLLEDKFLFLKVRIFTSIKRSVLVSPSLDPYQSPWAFGCFFTAAEDPITKPSSAGGGIFFSWITDSRTPPPTLFHLPTGTAKPPPPVPMGPTTKFQQNLQFP
jgi:hypothetical protein